MGFEENLKTNAYIRFKIFRVSKFKRRINMRRKHFTNWTPYLNILSDWSTEYRFFAKHAKLLLNMNLLNYSFIGFNILRIGAYSREFVNFFTKFTGSSNLNVINSYFRSSASNKLNLNFLESNALLHISSNTKVFDWMFYLDLEIPFMGRAVWLCKLIHIWMTSLEHKHCKC